MTVGGAVRAALAFPAERAFDKVLLHASRKRLEAQRAVVLSFKVSLQGRGIEPTEAQLKHYAKCVGAEERLRRAQVGALLGRIAMGSTVPSIPSPLGLAAGADE